MNFLGFLLGFLILVSSDCLIGFLIWILYKYIDLKYFSDFEITTLKEENKYLRQENKKINGTSADFWDDKKGRNKL
uniref:Uncharacterized protein n=1 Tax=Dulem virus 59 TaxID=3145770 RepID=A0AAU8B7T9_9VIRU